MASALKGFLIVSISTVLGAITSVLICMAGQLVSLPVAAAIGAIIGCLYGLEAGILLIYDLDETKGWTELLLDLTWSLPNTAFGFILGNLFYPFFGFLSREQSEGQGWIVYAREAELHQTLGTLNLGGAGQHERMHLLQARIFGPLFLPLYAVFYVFTTLLQVTWTFTIGLALYLLKLRPKPYLRPPSQSVVSGFFGWIYYATPFELWAYASGNP